MNDSTSLFGTNGVRGIANLELTPELVLELARSLGTYINGTIVLGMDTRTSGEMLQHAFLSGLLSTGCDVINVGISPTPAIQYYVRDHADAGAIVTASHNPREYNGVKFIASDGTEFSRESEAKVREIFESRKFRATHWDAIGCESTEDIVPPYKQAIKNVVDAGKISKANLKVVVDPGNGSGSSVTPSLLEELGCDVVAINNDGDGTFPNRPPEPTGDVLEELSAVVKESGADLGVAHDGDADRAVIMDENGNFVMEDVFLAIMTNHLIEENDIMVTPISSSLCVRDIVEQNGGTLLWTPVGSMYVARKMMETGARFGGEGNGGLIFPEHQYCRDGAMAVAKMLELLSEGRKVSELVEEIPRYYHVKQKTHCENCNTVLKHVLNSFPDADTTDGAKINYDDGWLLIRPSGTEPLVRVYAESKSEKKAQELADQGMRLVEEV